MTKRRSLDDALTPEEQAFLSEGQQPSQPTQTVSEKPAPKLSHSDSEPPVELPTHPRVPVTGVVSVNVRIEPDIGEALLRASLERKMNRVQPFTQKDIVAEALSQWLKKAGYLSKSS